MSLDFLFVFGSPQVDPPPKVQVQVEQEWTNWKVSAMIKITVSFGLV
jgi:hypothetical protein